MDSASLADSEMQSKSGSTVFGAEISSEQKPILSMLCLAIRGKQPPLTSILDRKQYKHCLVVANVAKDMLGNVERAKTIEALVVGATTQSLDTMSVRKVYTGKKGVAQKLAEANALVLDKSVTTLKDIPDGIVWTIFMDSYDQDWPVDVQTAMSKKSSRPLHQSLHFLSGYLLHLNSHP